MQQKRHQFNHVIGEEDDKEELAAPERTSIRLLNVAKNEMNILNQFF